MAFGQENHEENNEEEEESSSRRVAKSKKIEKDKKKPKKEKEKFKELSITELDEVIKKLNTHITWAYRYIYPEELKKKQELVK